jgi:hypothetical protein
MNFNSFERYQWVLTPDGKEYILVDTQTNQLVLGAKRYVQLTTATEATDTIQVSPEDYDNISTGNIEGEKK